MRNVALMKRMANTDIGYTADQIDALLKSGSLERLGMGSRRACYRLPGTNLCVKCYRNGDEIAEIYRGSGIEVFQCSPDNTEEAQRLLYYAGAKQLYVRDPWDSVIWYALEHKLSVGETNELLQKLNAGKLLG